MSKEQLKLYLTSALGELERLTADLQQKPNVSRQDEVYFLLRELVAEQMGSRESENTSTADNAAR